jgi:magnesium transporter
MPAERTVNDPLDSLNKAFMINFPAEAARMIAIMPPDEAAEILKELPAHIMVHMVERLSHGVIDAIFKSLPDEKAIELLGAMDAGLSTALLSRLAEEQRSHYLSMLDASLAEELGNLLEYPEDSAGQLMQTKVFAFNEGIPVAKAVANLKLQKIKKLRHIFLLDDESRLSGRVDMQELAMAGPKDLLASLATPITVAVQALDPKAEVLDKLDKYRVETLPVVDINFRLVGAIEGQGLIEALREDLSADMQTMVGVSRDERALSSTWFAVRKRLPWLQINLLTAFMAAAVVGVFESTIAKYTALAVLLPIAAGQSGNTGAQALAVTMRGLTLREITIRHWLRVTLKEAGAGLINGVVTAITCGLGVFVWSRSTGLALIIALAMISSMTIAAISGALVPIVLKKLGQDPALSSSIILTTVTDITGFMAFLGIATLLSGMLVSG